MKHVARKRFGQHFLVDRGVIDAIVRAIDPKPVDLLIEIGPGLGALTEPLMVAKRVGATGQSIPPCRPLEVVEFDRDLVAKLKRRFKPDQLVVHEADALDFDFARLLGPGNLANGVRDDFPGGVPAGNPVDTLPTEALRIVGNLPYNISSPLLFHLFEVADRVRDQHFMLQREVVERMVATAGESEYGRLSVMLQVRYQMENLFEVPPEAFDPPPKVESAIVRMIPRRAALLDRSGHAWFAKLVALAFSQRRKMLRNTLKDYLPQLESAGISPTARAEEISVEDYVRLAKLTAPIAAEQAPAALRVACDRHPDDMDGAEIPRTSLRADT